MNCAICSGALVQAPVSGGHEGICVLVGNVANDESKKRISDLYFFGHRFLLF
jgi:hypothetical protein